MENPDFRRISQTVLKNPNNESYNNISSYTIKKANLNRNNLNPMQENNRYKVDEFSINPVLDKNE